MFMYTCYNVLTHEYSISLNLSPAPRILGSIKK